MAPSLSIDGALATITLCRPEVANRLEPEDLPVIVAHITAVNADPAVRVLQLRGEGRHFCSGAQIDRIGSGGSVRFEDMADAVENARPVTIAVVHGGVFGGATDMTLACDFRLGTPASQMFMPAARLGLHYYRRGLERYVTRLGIDTAKRLFLTAEKLDGQAMLACGFLTQLAPEDGLEAAVARLTETLCSMAPIPLLGMKKHLNRIARGELDPQDLATDIARSMASDDLREGAAAFAQRRTPVFKGR